MNSHPTIKLQGVVNSAKKERPNRIPGVMSQRQRAVTTWVICMVVPKEFGIRRAMWDAGEMKVVVKLTDA
jgi:hypothetical protein